MNKYTFRTLALLSFAALLLLAPTAAFAHERRTIGNGKYDVTVGWDVEPAFQGQKNAASIRIAQAGSNPAVPVTGAEKTLKVQIKQGAATKEFPLRTPFNQPGYYVADIIPDREGEYQFTFVGSIDGTPINDMFDTADRKFNKVENLSDLRFPAGASESAQLQQAAQAAQADAQMARLLGIAGLVVGALGLIVAAMALRGRSTGTAAATARPLPNRA